MRPFHTLAALVVLLAVAVGCKRKDNREPPYELPEPHPGFPPLLPLPATPAVYPATPGGLVAWTLDAIGNEVAQDTPDVGGIEHDSRDSKAFALLGKLLADLPRPRADATADRALIDAEFERLWVALDQYRETFYRQRIRDLVRGDKAARAAGHDMGPAGRLSINPPPPQPRPIGSGLDAQIGSRAWDKFEADATGTRANWIMQHRTNVLGRVRFTESLAINSPRSMTARLSGDVGRLRVGVVGVAAFDLAELNAAEVEFHAAHDSAIVRVGQGVRTLKLWAKRCLVLSRGAGSIHIESINMGDTEVVVVAY